MAQSDKHPTPGLGSGLVLTVVSSRPALGCALRVEPLKQQEQQQNKTKTGKAKPKLSKTFFSSLGGIYRCCFFENLF